jgi:hypothetical protein
MVGWPIDLGLAVQGSAHGREYMVERAAYLVVVGK